MDAAMHAFKSLGKSKPTEGLGLQLEDLARAATKKTLPAPDDELIQEVVDLINNSVTDPACPTLVVDMLHRRLTQSNPHKVYLATALAGKVLEKCPAALSGVKEEIYVDLAHIASKPLDRYQNNFKSEQQAKMNAFAILRSSGKHAQSVLRRTAGFGKMVSLTPMKPGGKSRTKLADSGEASKAAEEAKTEVAADAATKPPSKGWSVKHVSGKDAAMNAEYREKHDAKDSKLRAARAAREDEKAGRGTVGDTPEEAAKAAVAAEAAAATSSALAEATTEATKKGSSKDRKKKSSSSSGKHPSWPETKDSVETSIGISGSHTEMIQDLVKNLMSGNSAAPDFERQFLDDLVKEMTKFRAAFEHLMALLTTFHTPEASALLAKALKSIDEMNSTMAMYQDVVNSMPAPPDSSATEAPAAAAPPSRSRSSKEPLVSLAADPLSQYTPAAKRAPLIALDATPAGNLIDLDAGHRGGTSAAAASQSAPVDSFAQQPKQQGAPQAMPYGYMPAQMYQPQGQFQGGQQGMGYMPWGNGAPPQVMYMPVTGPNGEQGFAPVPMPQAMAYSAHGVPAGSGPPAAVQFMQGPNGYYMPMAMGAPAAASGGDGGARSNNPFAGDSDQSSVTAPSAQQFQQQSPLPPLGKTPSNGSLSALQHDMLSGGLGGAHHSSPGFVDNTGITARRNDSTGSGIFPAQAADSVLDGTGMRQWSGSDLPAAGANGSVSAAQQQQQRGVEGHAASFGAAAKSYTNPIYAPPQAGDAQQPTFDAIFDDIIAS